MTTGDIETTTEPLADGRLTATIDIGSQKYMVYEPKLAAWLALAQRVEAATAAPEPANRAERRLFERAARAAGNVPAGDAQTMNRLELNNVLIGVLEASLTNEDQLRLDTELSDPRSSLDLGDLWGASLAIINEFGPSLEKRAAAMNLKVPSLAVLQQAATLPAAPAPVRKATARKATKATSARAARR